MGAAPTRRRVYRGERWAPLLLLAPVVILLVLLVLGPIIYLIDTSLYRQNLFQVTPPRYVGTDNFYYLFTSTKFQVAITRMFVFSAVALTAEFLLGFALAAWVYRLRDLAGMAIIRTLLTTPILVAPIVAAVMWRFMYQPDFGVINYLIGLVGLPTPGWLSDPDIALFAIAAIDVWQWTPFVFLIVLAGMYSVPRSIYEAAELDRTSLWRQTFFITVPLLKRVLVIVLLLRSHRSASRLRVDRRDHAGRARRRVLHPARPDLGDGVHQLSDGRRVRRLSGAPRCRHHRDHTAYPRDLAPRCGGAQRAMIRDRRFSYGWYAPLLIVVASWLFPIIWTGMTSFKPEGGLIGLKPVFAFAPTLDNYIELFAEQGYGPLMLNSLLIAGGATALSIFLGSLAAYALSRSRLRGRNQIGLWILSLRMVPPIAVVVPFYLILSRGGLLDNYVGIVLVYLSFSLPFAVWMLQGFFSEVPRSIDEAAAADGAGPLKILFVFIVPLSRRRESRSLRCSRSCLRGTNSCSCFCSRRKNGSRFRCVSEAPSRRFRPIGVR